MAETKEEDITRYGVQGKNGTSDQIVSGHHSEYSVKYKDDDKDKIKKEKIHVKVTNRANVTYDDDGNVTKIDKLPDKRKTELYKCEDKGGMSDNFLTQERIDNRECLLVFTRDEADEEKSTVWQANEENIREVGDDFKIFTEAMANIHNDNTLDKDIRNTVDYIQRGGSTIARKRAETGSTPEDNRTKLENEAAATDPDASTNEAATETIGLDLTTLGNELNSNNQTRKRSNYGTYRYPSGENGKNDFIKFSILEYVPRKISDTKLGFEDRQKDRQANSIGTIILPVPAGIKDSNQVEWGEDKMNPLQTAFAEAALTTIQDGVGQTLEDAAAKLANKGLTDAAASAVKNVFAGRAVGVKNLLSRTEGAIINPNLELLFSGPKLRQFSFVYLLTPRDENEAKQIISIIRAFKQASSVQRTEQMIFLRTPNTFQVTYHRGDQKNKDEQHPYIGKMKECAMTSVSVEYTPANVYATFEGGYMTQYRLSLTMQELEPIFNSDYTESDQDNDSVPKIGY